MGRVDYMGMLVAVLLTGAMIGYGWIVFAAILSAMVGR